MIKSDFNKVNKYINDHAKKYLLYLIDSSLKLPLGGMGGNSTLGYLILKDNSMFSSKGCECKWINYSLNITFS